MTKNELKKLTAEVGEYWGDMMPMMAMEECGELIQAISKLKRAERKNKTTLGLKQNLVEEIGDVMISCMALLSQEDIDVDMVEAYVEMKLNKKY